MLTKLSRRKLAGYVADQAHDGVVPAAVLQEVAAYLIDSRRTRELTLVVRAIEDELAVRGIVVADVTSAHELSDQERSELKTFVGGSSVWLRETVDPAAIGGVQVSIPGKNMDATVKNKLQALKRAKL